MPKRTNPFQQLVAELQELGPAWKVEESLELPDRDTGELREVDVVAEVVAGGHGMFMCIEACDLKRVADVPWIERMSAKHARLPTSKLVLWSASGFTKAAQRKARALNHDIVVPGTSIPPWARIARVLIEARVKYVRPKYTPIIDYVDQDGKKQRLAAQLGTLLHDPGSNAVLAVGDAIKTLSKHAGVGDVLLDHAPEGSGDFHVAYPLPPGAEVELPSGTRASVDRFIIGIETMTEWAPIKSRSLAHRDKVASHVEAKLMDGKLTFIASELASGEQTVRAGVRKR